MTKIIKVKAKMAETMVRDIGSQDLSTIAALKQKRTLAFVNHFAITTVQFLNNFVKTCEQKLMHFERKLEKVEAATVLLEARLSSIPEMNTVKETTKPQDDHSETLTSVSNDEVKAPVEESPEKEPEVAPERPEYNVFLKMVQVGVPLQAVKLKVALEGLDPAVFEEIMKK